jgi:hypothetical protein
MIAGSSIINSLLLLFPYYDYFSKETTNIDLASLQATEVERERESEGKMYYILMASTYNFSNLLLVFLASLSLSHSRSHSISPMCFPLL